ncbi:hypothetical protein ACMSDP_20870 [Bacteroides thetaiotaomicron]|uniref:hypothetical protein n=1 Tax=Bacteroides thetaiotaomicron TaxID=818 RepID=UPI0039C3D29D
MKLHEIYTFSKQKKYLLVLNQGGVSLKPTPPSSPTNLFSVGKEDLKKLFLLNFLLIDP